MILRLNVIHAQQDIGRIPTRDGVCHAQRRHAVSDTIGSRAPVPRTQAVRRARGSLRTHSTQQAEARITLTRVAGPVALGFIARATNAYRAHRVHALPVNIGRPVRRQLMLPACRALATSLRTPTGLQEGRRTLLTIASGRASTISTWTEIEESVLRRWLLA